MATDCRILLEDGSVLLQEDGASDFLLEACVPAGGTDTGCDLLLEDGSLLLQEDGTSAFLLEQCVTVAVAPSGGGFLLPKGFRVPLEPDDAEVATAVLALMRRRRWRLDG